MVGLDGHIGDLMAIVSEVRARRRRHRRRASATASAATSWSGAALAEPAPSTPSAPSSRPCPGWASVAREPGEDRPRGWTPMAEDPARRPSGSSAGWSARRPGTGSPTRAGPTGGPTGRRWWPTSLPCAATHPFDVMASRGAGALRDGRRRPVRPSPPGVAWLGAHVPGRGRLRDRGRPTRRPPLASRPLRRASSRLVVARAARRPDADEDV